jgi:hypothetical protein
MHHFCIHVAFRVSTCSKYAVPIVLAECDLRPFGVIKADQLSMIRFA